ncbi:hypothetical protein CDD82_7168 [Ophiocordyceps australis]|uniref:Uncharacterized protein n=1 Tax=Ophiocordyceps australis TaxID=1399860 RepID=A0A2C5YSS0_9HYPO|nr:hypothetical protein CDD82_7168 [Ophiocordyceps australis]
MLHVMSATTPVGSIVFSILALLFISLLVLLILRFYLPLRTTPAHYLLPIFFALWLPAVVIILVPIDLASSAATDDAATRGIWLPQRVVLVSWRITYWLTFALTWFILPILAEYSDSGYRDPNEKLRYSLRENAQFYAIVTAAGAVGLVYVSIVYRLTFESLKALIMALSYCWGLVLAIYLMGHGLVSIPRRLIRSSSISGSLRRLQSKAPIVHEQKDDASVALEEIEAQVAELGRRKIGSAADFEDWIEELQDMAEMTRQQQPLAGFSTISQDRSVPTVITAKYLADVTRRLDRARHARCRYTDEWHSLVQEAADLQSILDSAASKKLVFGAASPHSTMWHKVHILTPYTRYLVYYYVLPNLRLAFGGLLSAASVCIIWSELVKSLLPKLSIIRLSVIHHWVGDKAQVGFAGQMISAMWICYMCAAALISLTEVKVWRGRALVKRNTGYESAFWYATQVAKLCIPLSYNFLTFLSSEVYTKTTFYAFLGKHIDFTKLGRWFDDLFPVILMFPVVATLFGLYGRVKRIFVGIDMYQDDQDTSAYGASSWREGQQLIDRELGGDSLLRRRDEALARLASAGGGGGRAAPTLTVPAARDTASTASSSRLAAAANKAPRTVQQTRTAYHDQVPEDDSLLHIFGHRVKNTLDTMEAPQWLVDIGQTVKPKWMGADGDAEQQSGSSRRNESDIRRWFGGNGQIRL